MPELRHKIPSQQDLPWRTAFGNPLRGLYCYAGAGGQGTPLHFDYLENLVRFRRSLGPVLTKLKITLKRRGVVLMSAYESRTFVDGAQNVVVRGSKRYKLLAPAEARKLYPVRQPCKGFYSKAPAAALTPGTPAADAFPAVQQVTIRCSPRAARTLHQVFGIARCAAEIVAHICHVQQAALLDVTVNAGDILYIPCCW